MIEFSVPLHHRFQRRIVFDFPISSAKCPAQTMHILTRCSQLVNCITFHYNTSHKTLNDPYTATLLTHVSKWQPHFEWCHVSVHALYIAFFVPWSSTFGLLWSTCWWIRYGRQHTRNYIPLHLESNQIWKSNSLRFPKLASKTILPKKMTIKNCHFK